MKNNQAECEQIEDDSLVNLTDSLEVHEKDEIKSLFCYGEEKIKKMIWKLKTDPKFCTSNEGEELLKNLRLRIETECAQIVICPPSSSYWQSIKNFDHMHKILCKFPNYIPHAIVPRLHKQEQKKLNKIERINKIHKSYRLSFRFKHLIASKNNINILIVDDLRTTGVTLHEIRSTIQSFTKCKVSCLTIAYEA